MAVTLSVLIHAFGLLTPLCTPATNKRQSGKERTGGEEETPPLP